MISSFDGYIYNLYIFVFGLFLWKGDMIIKQKKYVTTSFRYIKDNEIYDISIIRIYNNKEYITSLASIKVGTSLHALFN